MNDSSAKKFLYSAVCLYPILITSLVIFENFLGTFHLDSSTIRFANFLFLIGVLFIFKKIWFYEKDKDWKFKWTLLIVFFGFIALPVFWGKYIMGWGTKHETR